MKKRWIGFTLIAIMLLSCQASPAKETSNSLPSPVLNTDSPPTLTQVILPTKTNTPARPTAAISTVTQAEKAPLSALVVNTSKTFGNTTLTAWNPSPYAGMKVSLPLNMNQVTNPEVINGLTGAQKGFFATNGFVVLNTKEGQFNDIRHQVADLQGQPYYLTTDAVFHGVHLTFDELLKSVERTSLRPGMLDITRGTLKQIQAALPQLRGTSLEADGILALAYLSVAEKLFDPASETDPIVANLVSKQVDQIMAGAGRAKSVLLPGFEDDYGAYKPVGHYTEDPDLENYFRGMTWFGRVNFNLHGSDAAFVPSRAPLIITLALRKSSDTASQWLNINDVLSFLIGPTDDGGPAEYTVLMDQIYGDQADFINLADDALWQKFLSQSVQLPKPHINSTFASSLKVLAGEAGWRFMGQRFTFDGSIMQSLVYDNVQELNGKFREFPSGLDVMAVLGSGPALATLQAHGDTAYPNYSKTLAELQQAANQQTESDWLSRAYDSWLYAFMPVLASKDSSYPPFMQSAAWNYRELNTALGSWAELKHDTALYSKRPEGRGGGGPPSSPTPPAYVDPNPQVFYRLAYLVASIQEGLSNRGMDYSWGTYGLDSFGEKLKVLGDIAVKELSGVDLNEDDYWAIRSCIDPVECEKLMNETSGDALPMPPVPIVAAVAGARDQVLEVATGKLNRIYVVVPLNGKLQVAQGGIYSYYEFLQSRSNVLTDQQWQSQVENNAVQLPDWSGKFMLPGGNITNWIAFNIGDVYIINAAGDNLNLRETASTKANVVDVLKKGDFITILGGPVQADQHTWWQVKGFFTGTTGWVVENQAWYERAWGQSP